MTWERTGGPREFTKLDSMDIAIGWRYTIERAGEERTISVAVVGGRLRPSDLPDECRRAISSKGRSAVDDILDRDVPPRVILVTTGGLSERADL